MANEDLEVRIGANIDDLVRELKRAKKGLAGFENRMSRFSSNLRRSGERMKSVGASMTRYITLPMLLAGGAAVKMGSDFDESMTKIKTLVGIAGDEVDAMGITAKQMARDTGIASKDAAEALFFITSAGIKGATAMEVLEASLKASASGLGETKTVADLATSAMNAYGSEILSASKATDIMLAAVREGKLAPEELAQSMGRTLPIASAMGVEFNDVAAAFAALSRTGTGAAEAATQIRGIFSSLLKPTTEAEAALESLGLSSAGLRKSLADDGLLATLNILKSNFEGNSEAAALVFGNIRALSGVLDLVGKNSATTAEIFNKMNNTLGDTDRAFAKVQQSASFKLKKSLNDIKETFVDLGGVLLPVVIPAFKKLATFVKNISKAFGELEPQTRNMVLAFAGLTAALPLLITLTGTLLTVIGALLSPIGLVIAGITALGVVVFKNFDAIITKVSEFYNWFVKVYNQSIVLRGAIAFIGAAFKTVWIEAKFAFKSIWAYVKAVGNNIMALFTNIGKVISGVLTFDKNELKEGLSGILELDGKVFEEAGKEISKNAKEAATEIREAFSEAIGETISGQLEEKTPEQIKEGLSKMTEGITNYAKELGSKVGSFFTDGMATTTGGTQEGGGTLTGVTPKTDELTEDELRYKAHLEKMKAMMIEFNASINDIIGDSIAGTFGMLGDAIGNALARGGNVLKAAGNAILAGLSGLLGAMGDQLIKMGTAAVLAGTVVKLFGTISGIGAGIAAIAGGTLLKGIASSLGTSANQSSGGYSGNTGSTGNVGANAPTGSTTNYGNSGGGSSSLQNVVFEIQGTKLVGVLSNTLNRNKSLSGTLSIN